MPTPNAVNINCTNTPSDVDRQRCQPGRGRAIPRVPLRAGEPGRRRQLPHPQPRSAPVLFRGSGRASTPSGPRGHCQVQPGPSGLDPQNPDLGQVVVLFHAGQRLLKKLVFPLGTGPQAPWQASTPAPCHCAPTNRSTRPLISYGKHTVSWLGTGAPAVLRRWLLSGHGHNANAADPGGAAASREGGGHSVRRPLVDPMVGGFRQWSYGVHNHDYSPFATSQIQLPPPPDNTTVNSFFPARGVVGRARDQPARPDAPRLAGAVCGAAAAAMTTSRRASSTRVHRVGRGGRLRSSGARAPSQRQPEPSAGA